MSQSIEIMIAGLTGVFSGMALLYLSVKTTAYLMDKLPEDKKE